MLNRRYRAPRTLVWAAWTEPARLKRWFASPGHTLEECEIDLREGGAFRKVFRIPEGDRVTVAGEYRTIIEPEKLVYTWQATGAGREMPVTLVTVTFTEQDLDTDVEVTHEGLVGDAVFESHRNGWMNNLEQLADEVAAGE